MSRPTIRIGVSAATSTYSRFGASPTNFLHDVLRAFGRPGNVVDSADLLELDIAVEIHLQLQSTHFEPHPRGQRFRTGDRTVCKRLGHRMLDFALRTDADHFQKLANAQIQGFFIHRRTPCADDFRERKSKVTSSLL